MLLLGLDPGIADDLCPSLDVGFARGSFCDDGCGIDPQVLRAGREGHWGLPGMRERAEKIGARLRVWSRAAAGTEVALSVANSIAYESRMVEKLAGC